MIERWGRVLLHKAFPLAVRGRALYRQIARPITVGVRALVVENEQVLLVRAHGFTRWNFPGGAVQRGEPLWQAAARETYEETGCVVEPERLLGLYFTMHEGMTNHVAVYVCRAESSPQPSFNIEIAEARYWSLDALPPTTSSTVHRRLAEYRSGEVDLGGAW